jgi:LysM repeat protein
MLFNQELTWLRVARLSGVVSLSLAIVGCGVFGGGEPPSSGVPTAVKTSDLDTGPTEAVEEISATEAAVAGINDPATEPTTESKRDAIRPDAPMTYTVKRGDTLWDISSLFLRDPWLWPEIWQVNPQVENPHLIYPGDVLSLAYGADGSPQIRLTQFGAARLSPRLRSEGIDGPIATIPYSAIAAFLTRPSVVTKEQAKSAPHVLAMRDGHMIGATGHEIYVRGLSGGQNSRYNVIHVGEPIRDLEDGDVVGYHGIYAASAVVTKPGRVSKAVLTEGVRETLQGDRLIASEADIPTNFVPRAPKSDVSGQIISVVDGVELIGQFQVVVINRGTRHGLEVGHVLAVDDAGDVVRDKFANRSWAGLKVGSAFAPRVQLPNERTGTMMVFKTYDRISYALIVGASQTIRVADRVRNP